MKYAVFGLGVSALSAIKNLSKNEESFFVVNQGPVAQWQDQLREFSGAIAIEQKDFTSIFDQINCIILSPGIPSKLNILEEARTKNISVISEIEFAFQRSKTPVIAVTGTNGKTTVCEMLHQALEKCGLNVFLGGNIGHAYSEILNDEDYDYAVIEVSSFQLETVSSFDPIVSIITNITPSHMERYNSFDEYKAAKENIFQNNHEGLILCNYKVPKENAKLIKIADFDYTKANAIGEHNQLNFSTVFKVLSHLKLEKKIDFQNFINDFIPSPYRIQKIRELHGCLFINDGKSTNLDSTLAALKSINPEKCLLILGGKIRDKSIDFKKLSSFKGDIEIKAFGEARNYIAEALEQDFMINKYSNLEELMNSINIQEHKTVLFSPCFPSFDLYKNYIERAEHFNTLVGAL